MTMKLWTWNILKNINTGNCLTKFKGYSTQRSSYCDICKANKQNIDDCVYNALMNKN